MPKVLCSCIPIIESPEVLRLHTFHADDVPKVLCFLVCQDSDAPDLLLASWFTCSPRCQNGGSLILDSSPEVVWNGYYKN